MDRGRGGRDEQRLGQKKIGERKRQREGKREGINWEDKQQIREHTFLNIELDILSIHPRNLSSVLISRF